MHALQRSIKQFNIHPKVSFHPDGDVANHIKQKTLIIRLLLCRQYVPRISYYNVYTYLKVECWLPLFLIFFCHVWVFLSQCFFGKFWKVVEVDFVVSGHRSCDACTILLFTIYYLTPFSHACGEKDHVALETEPMGRLVSSFLISDQML